MTIFSPPIPYNEPILGYMPNSSELKTLHTELSRMKSTTVDIPLRIGKEKIFTEEKGQCIIPHDKSHVLGTFSQAGKEELEMAIAASKEAKDVWESMPWSERASVFLKMADLLAGPFRAKLNASTMLGQSKNVFQAEIDSACELIDFFRFNVSYMHQIYNEQPNSSKGVWNRMEYRPLEGFVFAVTPFNFTSIAGNLPTSPAMMGNTVLWKPASSAVYSAHYLMDLFEAAGLPPGAKATICQEILRQIRRERNGLPGYKIVINAHPAICDMLRREHKKAVDDAAVLFMRQILVKPHREYHLEQFDLKGA